MRLRKWMAATLRAAWQRTATVNLIVTRRCDLACSYCRVHGQGHAEISPQQWLAIARTLARRYAVFTVTGGEPLLYRGLPQHDRRRYRRRAPGLIPGQRGAGFEARSGRLPGWRGGASRV